VNGQANHWGKYVFTVYFSGCHHAHAVDQSLPVRPVLNGVAKICVFLYRSLGRSSIPRTVQMSVCFLLNQLFLNLFHIHGLKACPLVALFFMISHPHSLQGLLFLLLFSPLFQSTSVLFSYICQCSSIWTLTSKQRLLFIHLYFVHRQQTCSICLVIFRRPQGNILPRR
jgi:hypothetical protein